jgi:nucleoid-associated protein YgaU
MGLFDFARDIGNKIFSRDDEAAEKIKAHIEADNPGVKDLKVNYEQGLVEITGEAKDQEALEKTVLMAGNVRGVSEVKLAGETKPLEMVGNVVFYSIQSGDTLSAIAKRYYGNAMDYPRIFEANREVIKDPNKIFVGQKIRIPLS